MDESREWRRLEVDIPAQGELISKPGGAFSSRIVNVNPDGLCFTAPEGVKPGHEVRLILELPAIGRTEIRSKIVWAGFFEQSKSYRAGGKFDGVDEHEKGKFLRFYHLKVMYSLGG